MSLETDLTPRLELIRRLVHEQYARYLQAVQYGVEPPNRLMLNDAGYVVQEPTALEVPPEGQQMFRDAWEKWREDWENTTAAVDDLVSLVQGFYVIDRDDGVLEDVFRRLSDLSQLQDSATRDTGYLPPEGGGTVFDEVAYARYFADEHIYNVMLDIRDEVQLDRRYPDHLDSGVRLVSEHWDGVSAAAFFWHFSVPFDEAAARQLECVRQLAANVHTLRTIRDQTTLNIRQIIDNCIRSLGGAGEVEPLVPEPTILDQLVGDAKAFGDANTVAGLVFSSLGLILSTTALSITVGVLGVGSASYSFHQLLAAMEEAPDDIDLTVAALEPTGPPAPVLWSTQDAIRRLTDWMSSKDEALGRGLELDLAATDSLGSPKLWLHLPGDFSGDHDFRLNEATRQVGVTAPIVALRQLGQTELPETTAGHLDNAVTRLSECSLPAWVATYLPRSYTGVLAARDLLGQLLKTTSNNLQVWGDELVQIADEYERTDGDNAGALGGTMN